MEELDRLVWAVHRAYKIGRHEIRLRASSTTIAEWLDSTLDAYRMNDPHPDDLYDYSLILPDGGEVSGRPVRPLTILYRGTWQILRTAHPATAAGVLLEEFESMIFDERQDAIYVDSTVISGHGSTGLVTSSIIPGLQQHLRYAERKGLKFAASTFACIDPQAGTCIQMRRALDTPPDALAKFRGSISSNGTRDRLIVEEPVRIDTVVISMPVNSLVSELSPATALYRLATDTFNLEALGGRALSGLEALVRRANCYALGAGEARAVMDALSDAVQTS
jgi:hypothetical protein